MKKRISAIPVFSLILSLLLVSASFAGEAQVAAIKKSAVKTKVVKVVKKKPPVIPKDPISANYFYVSKAFDSMSGEQEKALILEKKNNRSDLKICKNAGYTSDYAEEIEEFKDQIDQNVSISQTLPESLLLLDGEVLSAIDRADFIADKEFLEEATSSYKTEFRAIAGKIKGATAEMSRLNVLKNNALKKFISSDKKGDVDVAKKYLLKAVDIKESINDLAQDILDLHIEAVNLCVDVKIPDPEPVEDVSKSDKTKSAEPVKPAESPAPASK